MRALVYTVLVIELLFAFFYGRHIRVKEAKVKKLNNDFREYYEVVSRWIILKNSGRKPEEYFRFHGIKRIAIYGAGPLGEMLYQELFGGEVQILYVVDQTRKEFENVKGAKVIHPSLIPNQEMPDAIVITPMVFKTAILDVLCNLNLPNSVSFLMLDEIVNFFMSHEVQNEII